MVIYIILHTTMKLLIKSYEPQMVAIELQVCHPSVPHQLALGYKPSHPPLLCPPTQNLPNIDLMKSPASCPRSITAASQCVWALRLHYHLQMSPAVSRSFLHIILYLIPCFYHFRIHFFFHDHASSSSQSPPEHTIHP